MLPAALVILNLSNRPQEDDVPQARFPASPTQESVEQPAFTPEAPQPVFPASTTQESVEQSAFTPEAPQPVKDVARAAERRHALRHRSLADRLEWLARTVAGEPDPIAFERSLIHWLAAVHPTEMASALAYVQHAGFEERMALEIETRLVRQWTGQNAMAAGQWVSQLPASPQRDQDLETIAIAYSEQDLPAAIAWARQLAEGDDRDRIFAAVANEVLRTDPVQALKLAGNLPATPANDEMIRRAAMEWTAQDQAKALRWAEQLPDRAFRAQVLADMAVVWSDWDPVAAGRMVLKEVPGGRPQEDALVSIAQRWAQQSPEATAQWINGFPSGNLKQAAIESVVAIWRQSDPEAAAGWESAEAAGRP